MKDTFEFILDMLLLIALVLLISSKSNAAERFSHVKDFVRTLNGQATVCLYHDDKNSFSSENLKILEKLEAKRADVRFVYVTYDKWDEFGFTSKPFPGYVFFLNDQETKIYFGGVKTEDELIKLMDDAFLE